MTDAIHITLTTDERAQLDALGAEGRDAPPPLPMRLAAAWYRHAPRAKGAGTRWIGRRCAGAENWSFRLPVVPSAVVQAEREDVRMVVDPLGLDTYVSILTQGSWEPWILRPLQAALAHGGVLWDVGANVGFMTLQCAALPDTRVVAFEPQPRLARRIVQSAYASGLDNITVVAAALGEQEGECFLRLPEHNLHASISPTKAHDTITCPIYRLDDLVEEHGLPAPTVMKVDVEGGEMEVFRGAEQTIARHGPTLVFEENGSGQAFGYDRAKMLGWLRQRCDYRFFAIGRNDIIAAKPEHAEIFAAYQQIDAE